MAGRDREPGEAFQRVVNALESLGRKVSLRADGASAQCPGHDDGKPSLSITDKDDRVLIHCHAGCHTEDVVEALGLSMADLHNAITGGSSPAASSEPVAEYRYHDEQNALLYRVVRYKPKDFRQHRWDGTAWDPTLGDAQRVLYRLPELAAATAKSQWVFVVEGEKDADRLTDEGWTATTIAMGANAGNWDNTDTSVLDDAFVAVIGDNDGPGRKYARHVASSLAGRAAQVRLLRLTGLPEKGDVSDWLDGENTAADLGRILDSTPEWRQSRPKFDGARPCLTVGGISMYSADDLRYWARKPMKWRVPGVLIRGTNLVVGGSKKALKTTLASAELAFAVANGLPWLDHEDFAVEESTPVLVVLNEGVKPYLRSLDRIAQRRGLDSFGDIYVIEANGLTMDDEDLKELIASAAREYDVGMIIYDAWYGFVPADAEAASLFSMRKVFGVVQSVAEDAGADAVIVHHLTKHSKGKPELDNLSFAGIAEWADSWLLVTHREPARPEEGEYRLGLVAGSRQWGELTYELDGSFGTVDIEHAGYTQPPRWRVTKVDADTSDGWGKGSGSSTVDPEASLMTFIIRHPYKCTKSQVCKEAPGGEKANRDAFDRLIRSGALVVAKKERREGDRIVLRPLVGPSGVDPAAAEQQRLAPIGNDLPANVGEHGAGNSPKAAVSAPSEPQLDTNVGRAADVDNPDTPTLSEATPVPAVVPDRRSGAPSHESHRGDEDPPTAPALCIRCGEHHPPTPAGSINWQCYTIETERELRRREGSA